VVGRVGGARVYCVPPTPYCTSHPLLVMSGGDTRHLSATMRSRFSVNPLLVRSGEYSHENHPGSAQKAVSIPCWSGRGSTDLLVAREPATRPVSIPCWSGRGSTAISRLCWLSHSCVSIPCWSGRGSTGKGDISSDKRRSRVNPLLVRSGEYSYPCAPAPLWNRCVNPLLVRSGEYSRNILHMAL